MGFPVLHLPTTVHLHLHTIVLPGALAHFLSLLRDPHPPALRVALLSVLEPLLGDTWAENDLVVCAEHACPSLLECWLGKYVSRIASWSMQSAWRHL